MKNEEIKQPYHHGNLKAELLNVAKKILEEQGIDKVTLREIAREVGVSHTAPQRHFKNRQELLNELSLIGYSDLGLVIEQNAITAENASYKDTLIKAVNGFASFATDNKNLFQLMNSSKQSDITGEVKETSRKAFLPILEIIIEGQKKSIIQKGDPEEIGFLLYSTILGITTMINSGLVDSTKLSEFVDEAVVHFIRGFSPA